MTKRVSKGRPYVISLLYLRLCKLHKIYYYPIQTSQLTWVLLFINHDEGNDVSFCVDGNTILWVLDVKLVVLLEFTIFFLYRIVEVIHKKDRYFFVQDKLKSPYLNTIDMYTININQEYSVKNRDFVKYFN